MSNTPLDGIEVVEICSAIAGPFACKVLGDYGAHVTKVEPLGGETYRNLPPLHGWVEREDIVPRFLPYNTSKDSIAVDMKTDDGRAVVSELIDEADILVENMRPGVMERLGFPWEDLAESNPGLIYCNITGYGNDGPYVHWPAMDTTVQAVAGWADQIGAGDSPESTNIYLLDHATALYAAFAASMALVERGTTGEGQKIDISMLEVGISFLGHHFAEYSAAEHADREAKYLGSNAPNDVIEVADGYVAIYVSAEGWPAFCEAIGRPEFAEDGHRFATKADRIDRQLELREALEGAMQGKTKLEWAELINEEIERSFCAPVNRVGDLLSDPQVGEQGSIQTHEHPDVGRYTLPRPALRFSGEDPELEHAPRLGEHTTDILMALGYSDAEISELRDRGVVG